jgi:PAS domain-containing protein
VSKSMPSTNIETPDWRRDMATTLEELNEGAVVIDDQLQVIFANEALTLMGHFERNQTQGCTPDAIFPREDLPIQKRVLSGLIVVCFGRFWVLQTTSEVFTRTSLHNSLERLTECGVGLVTDQSSDFWELFVTPFK